LVKAQREPYRRIVLIILIGQMSEFQALAQGLVKEYYIMTALLMDKLFSEEA
jgi:hypothetical protein